jgi:uncharacterized protein YaaN involved in tellurite resistance
MDNQTIPPIPPLTPSADLTPQQSPVQIVSSQAIDKDGNVNVAAIAPADQPKYEAMAKTITPADVNSILNYGSDVSNSMDRYSNDMLRSVRTYNSGEVGGLISDLLTQLNYIDVNELEQSPIKHFLSSIPFLNRLVVDAQKLFQKYDTVIGNIDQIANKIKAGRLNSIKDNASLQTTFDTNVTYIKQMEELIIAGNLKMKELNDQLAEMVANAANYQDYQIADLRDFISRLDKRLADMKIIRYTMLMSLPQIRLVQNNNTSIAEKAQSIISTTIPIWKNQLTIAIALQRQKANAEMQKAVSDTTNTILLKNAELLKQNSIEVAKENEKTVISIDTLRQTTSSLIDTLNEVKKIHDDGAQKRVELNKDLQELETRLKEGVTSIK